jgi:hypothetical protein
MHPPLLNLLGLGVTIVAIALLFLFPPLVRVYTDKGEQVVNLVAPTGSAGRAPGGRRRRYSRLALAGLVLGIALQVAALFAPGVGPGPLREADRDGLPPPECASAASAEECADLLAQAGKNPYAAYGVVGPAPRFRAHGSRSRARANGPPGSGTAASAGTAESAPAAADADAEVPAAATRYAGSGTRLRYTGSRPIEVFGFAIVYGHGASLQGDTGTPWALAAYSIGAYDDLVRIYYSASRSTPPVAGQDLVRTTGAICQEAQRLGAALPEDWAVEIRLVQWPDETPLFGPFEIRRSDCR